MDLPLTTARTSPGHQRGLSHGHGHRCTGQPSRAARTRASLTTRPDVDRLRARPSGSSSLRWRRGGAGHARVTAGSERTRRSRRAMRRGRCRRPMLRHRGGGTRRRTRGPVPRTTRCGRTAGVLYDPARRAGSLASSFGTATRVSRTETTPTAATSTATSPAETPVRWRPALASRASTTTPIRITALQNPANTFHAFQDPDGGDHQPRAGTIPSSRLGAARPFGPQAPMIVSSSRKLHPALPVLARSKRHPLQAEGQLSDRRRSVLRRTVVRDVLPRRCRFGNAPPARCQVFARVRVPVLPRLRQARTDHPHLQWLPNYDL